VDWKKIQKIINDEHTQKGYAGRFGPGLPRVSDGSLLFLLHLVSKMRPLEKGKNGKMEGGSRIGIILNGSPLFTGGAGDVRAPGRCALCYLGMPRRKTQRPFTALVRPFRARMFVPFPNPGRCPGLTYFAPLGHRLPAPTGHPKVAKGNALGGKIDQLKAKAERGIELLKERRSALISAAVTGKIDVRSVAAVSNRQAQPSKTRIGG
jgi:hypothetical protein